MNMMKFAGETGRQVSHDWPSAPFVKPPETVGHYLDVVVLGLTVVWSENRFGRKVGAKDAATTPPVLETDVLLCEHARSGIPFRLAVRGAGLVPGLCRHVKDIDWPRGGNEPKEQRPAPVMFNVPILISLRCTGTRKADVGEYVAYSVGEVLCDDVEAFVAEFRRKHAGDPAENLDSDDDFPL